MYLPIFTGGTIFTLRAQQARIFQHSLEKVGTVSLIEKKVLHCREFAVDQGTFSVDNGGRFRRYENGG